MKDFLVGGIVWIYDDSLSVSVCGSAIWDSSDGEICFQGLC